MKTLYLIRHAKSSWEDLDLSDPERPLNERGQRDAPRMGKRLKEKEVTPDLMLSSPAVRALITCQVIAGVLGYPEENIQTDKRLYHADEDDLLAVLRELNDNLDMVLIFGHNPGLTVFANSLLNEHILNVPTCGIVCGQLKIKSWKDSKPGCGKLEFFDFPKRNIRK